MTARWTLTAIAVALGTALAASVALAQQAGGSDSDGDGLIEVASLEQLDAIRWDLNGDGVADDAANAGAYAAAFPDGTRCASGCTGYELARGLDFRDPASYASGAVNTAWTEGAGWTHIGGHRDPFEATFDGNGETIANLFIDRPDESYAGLFGEITGTVRGLGLVNARVKALDTVGGLAGANSGTVADSYATGGVSGFNSAGGLVGANYGEIVRGSSAVSVSAVNVVGGLAALNYGAITGSSATGRVTGSGRSAGGLVAINFGEISGSYTAGATEAGDVAGGLVAVNQGPISASYTVGVVSGQGDDVGGIAGINYDDIRGSFSIAWVAGHHRVGGLVGMNRGTGAVSASYATGRVTGGVGVGGLAGWSLGSIDTSYATGTVSGDENDVGGLVGRNAGAISVSYATGDVSSSHRVGGLVGYSNRDGAIRDAYATGAVSGEFESGGLVGWNSGDIGASYATGAVTSIRDAGGLVGENEASGVITDSFWDVETSGLNVGVAYGAVSGAQGKTTAELQSTDSVGVACATVFPLPPECTFANWDGDVWDFGDASQYPVLKASLDADGAASAGEFGAQSRTVDQRFPRPSLEVAHLIGGIARWLDVDGVTERGYLLRAACRNAIDALSDLRLTSGGVQRGALALIWLCLDIDAEQGSR